MSSENRNEHVVQVKDKDGFPVFLAEAVWNEHILLRHPEIEPYKVKYLYQEEYNSQRTGFISSVYFVGKVKRGGRIV